MKENDFQKINTQVIKLVEDKYKLIKLKTIKKSIETSSTLLYKSIIACFLLSFYLFVNIAAGVFIGDLLKSTALGFVVISLINLSLFILFSFFGKNYMIKIIRNKLTKSFFN